MSKSMHGTSSPGSASSSSSSRPEPNTNKNQPGYSFEWAALMGLSSLDEDEIPLMDYMDETKDGHYY
jgi:hypothetical protein